MSLSAICTESNLKITLPVESRGRFSSVNIDYLWMRNNLWDVTTGISEYYAKRARQNLNAEWLQSVLCTREF